MEIKSIFFSPTGGTQKVVDFLAQELGGAAQTIDLSIHHVDDLIMDAETVCIVGVPSFGGRVPAIALARLREIKANGARAILVVCYGNRDYDDTLLELQETALACGFKPIAALAAVTEHSMLPAFGAGRPDAADYETLRADAARIKHALSGDAPAAIAVKGNSPYRDYHGVPLKPIADKSCNACGLCAKSCPVGAIPISEPADTDKDKCITCMRCVKICPQHARKLNSVLLFAVSQKLKKACAERKEYELFL